MCIGHRGVRVDGTKELVAIADGHRESTERWADLLRDLKRRGIAAPALAVGDAPNFGEPGGFDISPWSNRVRLIDASHDGTWELPVLGEVTAPPAVSIRPDGQVAWAGVLTDPELPRALATPVRGGHSGSVDLPVT